jgi:fructose-1-phosphate kinase PfkB-like protein
LTGSGRPAVFGPHPLLTITIERQGGEDDVHVHAGGQGVWSSRVAGRLDAWPVLCGFAGGETGALVRALLARMPGERRLVSTEAATGSYVTDRRTGERRLLATRLSGAPSRHELDDLVSVTCAAALDSEALARAVIVTRGPEPALVLTRDRAWELVPPRFERGSREGCGDTMMGGLAAGLVTGRSWEDALILGAAAGAANFLRHGLGSVAAETVRELTGHVQLRELP